MALDAGAAVARVMPASRVVTAEWVRLKCQFGCAGYGKRLGCPPRTPTPGETRRVLAGYRHALILAGDEPRGRRARLAAEIERAAFLDGLYKAFGLGAGPCRLCAECNVGGRCRHPESGRPAMEACGIDVYATCRNAGIELNVVTSRRQKPRYVNLVLLD
jgi:predicted metal-binding protein